MNALLLSLVPVLLFLPWMACSFVLEIDCLVHSSRCRAEKSKLFGIQGGFRKFFGSTFPSATREIKSLHQSKRSKHGKDQKQSRCDHLLIDVNQYLHVIMRNKGEKWDQALIRLMSEMDELVRVCQPQKSLVLAIDGPPPAAKLATQRKRRQSTLDRTEAQMKLFELLLAKSHRNKKKRHAQKQRVQKILKRKQFRWVNDVAALAITPGTVFMDKVASALLFYAWQRLQNPYGPLSDVQICLSSSDVHGEGEVKLLEWLYRPETKIDRSDRVVLVGGDSDLVLQGLLIPPSLTRHVQILMPEKGGFIEVRVAEILESLRRHHLPHLASHINDTNSRYMMRIRTDLVLMFILSGNDYLPKLRGNPAFGAFFHLYTQLSRKWHEEGRGERAYLVDPYTLEFNRQFAIEFFGELVQVHGTPSKPTPSTQESIAPLSLLYNLMAMGILPKKARFEAVDPDTGAIDPALDTETEEKQVLMRLVLGVPGVDDLEVFEMNHTLTHPRSESIKAARHALAAIVISDYLGEGVEELGKLAGEPDGDDNMASERWSEQHVEENAEKYVYGLLWNLQEYRDGVCPDYGFNYAKRLAPTAQDLCEFFKQGKDVRLFTEPHVGPLSAGMSCVAALPLDVRHLLPEPYSTLSNSTIEGIHAACVDKVDSTFDVEKFAALIDESLPPTRKIDSSESRKKVRPNKIGWTVMSREASRSPIAWKPPMPFSSWLTELREDKHIWVWEWAALNHDESSPKVRGLADEPDVFDETENPASTDASSVPLSDAERTVSLVEPRTTPEGNKPTDILQKLAIETCLHAQWAAAADGPSVDKLTLTVQGTTDLLAEDVVVSCVRPERVKKKQLMQQMATTALDQIFGGLVWSNLSYRDLRNLLQKKRQNQREKATNTTRGIDAISCLKELQEAGLIAFAKWTSSKADAKLQSSETVTLSIKRGEASTDNDLWYEETRPQKTSRQKIKHHMASRAMRDMFGSSWEEQSMDSLKSFLSAQKAERQAR